MTKKELSAAAIAMAAVAAAIVAIGVKAGKPDYAKYMAERPVCVEIEGADEFWCPLPGQKAKPRVGPARLIDECSPPVCDEPGKAGKAAAVLDVAVP